MDPEESSDPRENFKEARLSGWTQAAATGMSEDGTDSAAAWDPLAR